MEHSFKTKCKSEYLRVIELCCEKRIPYKGLMDDYNCNFEIVYQNDKEITFNKYGIIFIGDTKYIKYEKGINVFKGEITK